MVEFVAKRRLEKNDRSGFYEPGEIIPDFAEWNIHARRACLNLEWVEERPVLVAGQDSLTPLAVEEAPKKKKGK